MFDAFIKGIGQLGEASSRKVVLISLGLSLVVFITLWMTIGFLLTNTAFFSYGWMDTAVDILGGLATAIITWFLFPAVISTVMSFYLEEIADAVEEKHYPGLVAARDVPLSETIIVTLKFFVALVALNLLMLVFLIIPPVFPFVFYGVNGYLLSREFFELVALRRLDPHQARGLRKAHKKTLLLAGILIALMLTIPGINLLAPIVATAAMVHLFERWRNDPRAVTLLQS